MKTISLNGTWQLTGCRQTGDNGTRISLPATVPGCVQLDLSKNGYPPVPFALYKDWMRKYGL